MTSRYAKQAEFLKASIRNKLDALHKKDGISDKQYNSLVVKLETCTDLNELKDMNDMSLQFKYAKFISSEVL